MVLPDKKLPWPISYEAVVEIAKSEGCRLHAYRCEAGIPTIAFGRTKGVRMGDTCTQEQADRWFCEDLTEFTADVRRHLKRDPSNNELGAFVSLAYNIGVGGFASSTVLRKFNEGDTLAAARAFSLWNKITKNGVKVVSNGLTARRAREAALFLTPDDGVQYEMPQQVESESSLTQSPIAQSGLVSILGGVAAAATAVIEPVKDFSDRLGMDPLVVIGIIGIVVGLVVMEQRNKQRKEGWA